MTIDPRVERLRRLDACAVSDALDKCGLKGVVTGIPQLSGASAQLPKFAKHCSILQHELRKRRALAASASSAAFDLNFLEEFAAMVQELQIGGTSRIAGRAITVKLGVGTPGSGPPKHLCAGAIEMGGPENVIVVEQRSGVEAGSWGGLLSQGALVRGIAGVIVDGPVRDIDQSIELGFPVFARSLTSFTARGRIVERATNERVTVGEVLVDPGDYVIADRSAVIFVPESEIDRMLATAEDIAAREEAMAEALRAGKPIGAVMGGDYEHMLRS
jgi:regulator of RNase E activity RraA